MVACEGCGAKYAIPEDRSKARGARSDHVPPVLDAHRHQGIGDGSESKWYFAVGRDRQGPVSATDLAKKVEEGSLTLESLAWCQGMDGWVAISQISALASALGAGGDAERGAEDISDDTTMVSKSDIEAAHAEMSQLDRPPAPRHRPPLASKTSSQGRSPGRLSPKHERADTSCSSASMTSQRAPTTHCPGSASSAQNSEQSGLLDVTAAKPRSGNNAPHDAEPL